MAQPAKIPECPPGQEFSFALQECVPSASAPPPSGDQYSRKRKREEGGRRKTKKGRHGKRKTLRRKTRGRK